MQCSEQVIGRREQRVANSEQIIVWYLNMLNQDTLADNKLFPVPCTLTPILLPTYKGIMMKRIILILLIFISYSVFAVDFGFLTNQGAAYGGEGSDGAFEYSGSFVPRLSAPMGKNGSLFLSASFTINYAASDNSTLLVPELLLTEFKFNWDAWKLSFGRINYSEPYGFIANGLFDGVHVRGNTTAGIFGFGIWYTGLLYKENTIITMTAEDTARYQTKLDYSNFYNTYFSSGRLLFAVDWEYPSFAEILRLRAAVTGQFDLTEAAQKINSQYITLKAGLPINSFLIEAGASLAVIEEVDVEVDFAAELGFSWILPSSFLSRLSLSGNFAGSKFVPVTAKYIGKIYEEKITDHLVINLNYSARMTEKLGAQINASYFMNFEDKNSTLAGAEFFASLAWSPLSDLQINLGGGLFVPALGNIQPDDPVKWKISLSAVLSVY